MDARMERRVVEENCQCKRTRKWFTAYQQVFAPERVNALVEDYPSSNRKHRQPRQGAEGDHFLRPLRPANRPEGFEFLH